MGDETLTPVAVMGEAFDMIQSMTLIENSHKVSGARLGAMGATFFDRYRDADGVIYEYQGSNGGAILYRVDVNDGSVRPKPPPPPHSHSQTAFDG